MAALVTLALATFVLGGCIRVQVIDRTPAIQDPIDESGADGPEEHDLAVLAVDFDPPLVYEEILARKSRGEGITLLVAVENTGVNTEQKVDVDVRLSCDNGNIVLLRKVGVIDSIVPGEIKIVQFKDTDIPFRNEYQLEVSVVPVAGEVQVSDNLKRYDLTISAP